MKRAKIILSRYRNGSMSKKQVLSYISNAMHPMYDSVEIEYIKRNL